MHKIFLEELPLHSFFGGSIYHLKKIDSQLPIGLTPEILISSDSSEVMQITPLRYTRLSSFFGRDKAYLVSTSNGLFPLNAKFIVVC